MVAWEPGCSGRLLAIFWHKTSPDEITGFPWSRLVVVVVVACSRASSLMCAGAAWLGLGGYTAWHYIHCCAGACTGTSFTLLCCAGALKRVRVSVVRVPAPWPPVLCAACVVVSGCHCGGACICVDCTPTMTITLTPPAHAPRPPAQHPARARTRAQIFRAPAVPPPVCHNGLILVATDPEGPHMSWLCSKQTADFTSK